MMCSGTKEVKLSHCRFLKYACEIAREIAWEIARESAEEIAREIAWEIARETAWEWWRGQKNCKFFKLFFEECSKSRDDMEAKKNVPLHTRNLVYSGTKEFKFF